MHLNERIRKVRTDANLTQAQFAQRIGVSVPTVQLYEYGKSVPKMNNIRVICQQFGINQEWLQEQKGDMRVKQDDQALVKRALSELDDFQKACILAIVRTEGGWEKLRDVMENLHNILEQERKNKE